MKLKNGKEDEVKIEQGPGDYHRAKNHRLKLRQFLSTM